MNMPKLISISEEDLARLLQENVRLSEQVTELQARGTELVMEMRRLSTHTFDLPFKFFGNAICAPNYASDGAAGIDLMSQISGSIVAGGRMRVPTGIGIELPPGYTAKVLPRSGLALKKGLTAVDGTIDSDYRGEISVVMHNVGYDTHSFSVGDRIAQMLIQPVARVRLVQVPRLSETRRGEGGFGSTGT